MRQERAVTQNRNRNWQSRIGLAGLLGAALAVGLGGCEADSWMDPSVVGRWEHTPITMPILDRIDVIESRDLLEVSLSEVTPDDLRPDFNEYTLAPNDTIAVIIFELVDPGQEAAYQRQIDATGLVRMPFVGPVRAAGKTASQLEDHIADLLERRDIIRDATVSVILQGSTLNTFTVAASPLTGGTRSGMYSIPRPDFRLMDALAMANGVPDRTQRLLVIRQTPLSSDVAGMVPEGVGDEGDEPVEAAPPAPEDPSKLIEELLEGVESGSGTAAPQAPQSEAAPPPAGLESSLDRRGRQAQWVNVGGEWVRVGADEATDGAAAAMANAAELSRVVTQRVIEVPFDRLNAGDMRYNVIIRPGDIIKVPGQQGGFVYLGGAINRPGAYNIPGEKDLTLKQLIVSGGGLSAIGIPERVDLIRRIGNDQEATVRINLRAIFDGTEPDLFLKANDVINIGTNAVATPLAIFRNGLRMTYGFGFVLDRNWNTDVFGR
jgi:protein involved in polysaccharide export with SLBB domain